MVNTAAPIDATILQQVRPFTDVLRQGQNNQIANQAAQIDNASKANIYKTQVLSAAAATGNQDVYNTALQYLARNGIDVSDVPQDVKTGGAYVDAARLAQSPLGTLFGAQQKILGNNLQAVQTYGSQDAAKQAGAYQEIPNLTGVGVPSVPGINAMPAAVVAQTPVGQSPQAISQSPQINSVSPIQQQPANQGSIQIPAKPLLQPAAIDGAQPAITISQKPVQSPTIDSLSPPVQQPGESQGAYNQRFEQFKSSPAYIAATGELEAKSRVLGKDQGENADAAVSSDEITQRLLNNIDKLRSLNSQIPGGFLASPEDKAKLQQRFLNDSSANDAIKQWQQVDQQQIISDLQQLVKGNPGLRSNKTIDQMLQRGSGVPLDASQEGRGELLNNLRSEILNKNTTTQNTNTRLNNTGAPIQQYQPIGSQGLPTFSDPNDPNFLKLPSGTQFIDDAGVTRIKH